VAKQRKEKLCLPSNATFEKGVTKRRSKRSPKVQRASVHETGEVPVEYIYILVRETPGSHRTKAGKALPDRRSQAG